MTIKSALYYWAVCDGEDCNARCPNDEVQAWDDPAHVLDSMDGDWRTSDDGKHYCMDCWLYDDADNLVFNVGSAAAVVEQVPAVAAADPGGVDAPSGSSAAVVEGER